jgi:cohesin complex subunit SA-1/2
MLTLEPLVDPNSPTQFLNEYAFIELVVTFLRAIRAGVLHVRHTAILLSHYGRLGATFDQFTKPIVDILRDEGMSKDNGDVVVVVINQALQEVGPFFLPL